MSEAATSDIWSDWLLKRRFSSDPGENARAMSRLAEVRTRVLNRAKVEARNVVLDVGCGDGLIAFGALERVGPEGRVIFCDISQPLLDESRRIARELGVEERCEFVNARADHLSGLADASVDVVTTRSVLIFVDDKDEAFREFFRVLRPGGRISLFEPINRLWREFWDFTRPGMGDPEVRDLVERIRAHFDRLQPPESDSMLAFDDRDLLRSCLAAGFWNVDLQLEVSVRDAPAMTWDGWISSAGNPRIPSLGEVIAAIFTTEERERYEQALRSKIESGRAPNFMAIAWLAAQKRGMDRDGSDD